MVALLDLQKHLAQSLLSPASAALPQELAECLSGDWLSGQARLAIHRNNLLLGLTEALAATFPAVRRLVGPAFFAQVARAFVRCQPPREARLSAYGSGFPDFLSALPDLADLPYIADVARLEWAVNEAFHAPVPPPAAPQVLSGLLPTATQRLSLLLQPSLRYLDSPWPIARIWQANRDDAAATEESISLDAGGCCLEIRRREDNVVYRELEVASFAFRRALARGRPLIEAVEAAFGLDPLFDLAADLGGLLSEGLIVGCSSAPTASRET